MSKRHFLLLNLAILVSLFARPGFAQSTPPLNFGNNYFVTGDYVVGGVGLSGEAFGGYATGIISIPDANPGITGTKSVPAGAQIVAALLYWETIEIVGGHTGQNGFFRPLFIGGPLTGYPIKGTSLANPEAPVYWSSGGCASSSPTSKQLVAYRADVRAYLRQDSSGNVLGNGLYEVRIASQNDGVPRTLGATLVIIYRVLSPNFPLNSIVIYDGAFAPSNASLTMTQTVQGFYQAAKNPVSKLTHIVGNGQKNQPETVSLNGMRLPSLYPNRPPFPGWYEGGGWDNPTWIFPIQHYPPFVSEDEASATTVVNMTEEGCVAHGAVIFSTTVKNSDNDGLLDVWKAPPLSPNRPGYCDASVNEGVCYPGDPSWVDLPGATPRQKDVFIQLDYMCSTVAGVDSCLTGNGTDYSFDPRPSGAVDMMTSMFSAKGIHVHVNPNASQPVHAIPEPTCTDIPGPPPQLCAFPNQPGVVAWKGGFGFFKNELVDPKTGNVCTSSPPAPNCMPRFQHGQKDSVHYALFAHALGQTKWKLQDGTLSWVVAFGKTVTFATSTPHGLQDHDTVDGLGRVTVVDAITNPSLNGTYYVYKVLDSTHFQIQIANATIGIYIFSTDPNLAVAPGKAPSYSGRSDVGGGDSLITLGLWGDPSSPTSDGQTEQVIAGTFTHEFGHSAGLLHGAVYFDNLSRNPNDYTPTVEANCKPNYQSVMNYLFQVDLLDNGGPNNVLDYSEQALNTLNESVATSSPFTSPVPTYFSTSWYAPTSLVGGTSATLHCDGTPIPAGAAPMSRVPGLTSSLFWTAGQDINFDGNASEVLRGHNDWIGTATSPGIDLRQIGATGSISVAAGNGFNGGGNGFNGGGNGFNGGGNGFNGGGNGFNGGGNGFNGGGNGFNGGGSGEITHETANSVTRPPRNLMASEEASARFIDLSWTQPTFGQIGTYNIYRSSDNGAHFTFHASVPGTSLTYQDTVTCNPTGYKYFVTAVLAGTNPPQESVPSNTAPSSGPPLTGCYTNTPLTVALTPLTVGGPNPVTQGSAVPIAWSLQDDNNGQYVNNLNANTLVAIGPFPHDGACPQNVPANTTVTTLLSQGKVNPNYSTSTFGVNAGPNYQFTFNWDTRPFSAGCYLFQLNLDSGQSETSASALQLLIYVSDRSPYITTTSLPDGVVGSAYSNALYSAGGNGTVTWSVVSGSLPPNITLNSASGTLSGTPTAGGIFNFTAQATDSAGNFGTRAFTLRVLRDVVVVDGSPSATSGTLLRIRGGTSTTIATIPNGSPTGVVMDGASGNIYVAVALGAPRIVQVTSLGVVTDPFIAGVPTTGAVLASPVAVAVDSSENLYVGDNSLHAIYKFNSSGAQVDAAGNPTSSAFAILPPSASLNDIRMTFDGGGNLIVASDNIGTVSGSGTVEVDQVATSGATAGTPIVLYNTSTKPGSGPAIASVGGIALLSDGSIDVADSFAHAIYKIANPGAVTMAITTAVGPTDALCCNISGMANPPSAMDTTLYVTLNGVSNGPRLVLAVPEMNSVSTLLSGTPLTFPNDVAPFTPRITYFVDGLGNFGTLDLITGVAKIIGTGTVSGNTGLDLTPAGQVYEYNTSNQLLNVNASTGATTLVGTGSIPQPGLTTTGGLTDGSYFGIDMSSGNLYSINLSTGATMPVGPTTTAVLPQNCGFETSLAGSANVLYYTIGIVGTNCPSPMPDTLYQIDPTSGATTTIGKVSVDGFVGSAYVNGTLYGFTYDGKEYSIAPTTGVATLLTTTTARVYGAASTSTGVF